MDTMTPNQAIQWLMSNDHSLGTAMNTITTSQRAIQELPVGSPARQGHQQILDDQLQQVTQARREQRLEQAGIDPAHASPACDCKPGEPCCLRAFVVEDAGNATRKIEWPVGKGKPDTLFIVVKEPYNGSPSGKVNVKLTDFESCKCGKEGRPGMHHSGYVEGNRDLVPAKAKGPPQSTLTATVPFHLPAILSAFFPTEILQAIYILGYYTLASAYRDDSGPRNWPNTCATDQPGAVKVHPVPHMKLSGSVEGKVGVTFYFSSLPTVLNEFTGTLTGEVGSQKLEYKSEKTNKVADKNPRAQGPVRNPMLQVISTIFEKVKWMSEAGAEGYDAKGGIATSGRPSISVELALTLSLDSLALKGKSASPDLELSIQPVTLRCALTVTGKMDLLGMLIDRVPGISGALHDAREAMAREGNPVQAELKCELVLSASGGLEFGIENTSVITIGSQPGWESPFQNISTRWQADAKITGKLEAIAKVGVDTWLFDGIAGIEGSVSTGWHFGGRTIIAADGKKSRQTLYFFEGLVLTGSYYVRTGGTSSKTDSSTFPTGGSRTTGTRDRKKSTSNTTDLIDRKFTATFFSSEGSKDDWKNSS